MKFEDLKKFTQARVGLGNSGGSIPTKQWLNFAYSHAAAVDAVHIPWELPLDLDYQFEVLSSRVNDRAEYLKRPDLGRLLSTESIDHLRAQNMTGDVLICVSNGLSSFSTANHLEGFLNALTVDLERNKLTLFGGKIFLIPNARVAVIDQIGEILKPKLSLMIIGERPGLSSPDSLACYMTYGAKKGLSDVNRNCISNIRPPHGLSYQEASSKTLYLVKEALRRKLSGVNLKDESDQIEVEKKLELE